MREDDVQTGTRVRMMWPGSQNPVAVGMIRDVQRVDGRLVSFVFEDDSGVQTLLTSPASLELMPSANGTPSYGIRPNGCVCRRCNSANRWAAPNKPDGSYVCFECR